MKHGKKTYAGLVVGICVIIYIAYKYLQIQNRLDDSVGGVLASVLVSGLFETPMFLTLIGGGCCVLASVLGIPYISLVGVLLGFIAAVKIPGESFSEAQMPYVISTVAMVIAFMIDWFVDAIRPAAKKSNPPTTPR